jgi:tetratricopeptide (TPR) repeat protein
MTARSFSLCTIIIVLSAIFIPTTFATTAKKSKHVQIGEKILSYIIEKDLSKSLSSDELEGKTILFVFVTIDQQFSTSVLRDIQNIVTNRAAKDFKAIGIVSSPKGYEGVEQLIERYHLNYQMLHDAGDIISTQLGIIVYPTTLIINSNGRLAYYYPLYASDYSAQVSSYLEKIINDKEEQYLNEVVAKRKENEAINKARKEIARGEVTEAITILNTLLEEGSTSFDLHLLLGYSLLNIQQPKKALVHFNKAQELNPDSAMVDLGMGLAFSRTDQREKALVHLQEAIKKDPVAPIAYRELARIHEEKGEVDKAIHYITKELDALTAQIED